MSNMIHQTRPNSVSWISYKVDEQSEMRGSELAYEWLNDYEISSGINADLYLGPLVRSRAKRFSVGLADEIEMSRLVAPTNEEHPDLAETAVLSYMPNHREFFFAHRAAAGFPLLVVEGPNFDANEWAASAGAPDLRSGEVPQTKLNDEVRDVLDHFLDSVGQDGWVYEAAQNGNRHRLAHLYRQKKFSLDQAHGYIMARRQIDLTSYKQIWGLGNTDYGMSMRQQSRGRI